MSLKKYHFALGICGPTVLYSSIIRAENEREAAMIFLAKDGKDLTEETINNQLRFIKEIVPKEIPDKLYDCVGEEIELGKDVLFIRNEYGKAPKLVLGVIDKICGKSIVINASDGVMNRIILPKGEPDSLPKVVILNKRPLRSGKENLDASGYPIAMDDPVAYMNPVYSGNCDGFQIGIVTSISAKTIQVDGTRREFDRVVVINWEK